MQKKKGNNKERAEIDETKRSKPIEKTMRLKSDSLTRSIKLIQL